MCSIAGRDWNSTLSNSVHTRAVSTTRARVLQGKLRLETKTMWTCCNAEPARINHQSHFCFTVL